jgi:D-alanyl-D-alanine carboxypeptidase
MSLGFASPRHRLAFVCVVAALAVVGASSERADARPAKQAQHRAIHGPDYRPPYAAIVVDANSGAVLHEDSADEPRHPASLTKIMTLYLLFEQIEAGNLKLDTPLPISAYAASQHPTKLGLKAGQTIMVEDAIKGLVTKSANDAAVVVSEALGGSEEDFAKLMTSKAQALGMAGTVYVNASGLPADDQITTARDQALLGRAIQQRFPTYYRYFSTPSFRYRNVEMHNHNGLLAKVEGCDGIKTGYTDASGYNLVSSVRRNSRHLVAVVLGGTSNAKRDARMRDLIEAHIMLASTQRTAPMIAAVAEETNPRAAAIALPALFSPARPAPAAEAAPSGILAPELASAKTEQVTTDRVQMSATPLPTPRPQIQAKKPQASKSAAAAKLRVRRAQPTATGRAANVGPTISATTLTQSREITRGWSNAN